jgi:hypothetical protein
MSRDKDTRPPRCTGTTARGTRCTKNAQPGSTRCAHHGFDIKAIGRPTSLTPELADAIVGLVLEGNYLKTAAEANGVSERLLHRWQERAGDIEAAALEHVDPDLEDVDLYEHVDPALWIYLDFRQSLKAAAAYAETELLRMVRFGGYGPWQAYMTILERRRPQHWRRRDSHEVEVSGEVRTKPQTLNPEGEARRRVAGILAESGALEESGDENTPDGKDDGDEA